MAIKITTSGIILLLLVVPVMMNCQSGPKKSNQDNPRQILIEAGRYLFYETRLSFNHTKSCGSCHDPKFAFTDGYRTSVTAGGDNVKHNAPSLINIAFHQYLDWANPGVTTLEKQHERPLFNVRPPEMGAKGNEALILGRLKAEPLYLRMLPLAFPGEKDPFDFVHIIRAIASFVASLQSASSPYDHFISGDTGALTASARAGMQLFFSGRLKCSSCHTPPYFTLATQTKRTDSVYINIGLYNLGNTNTYPPDDRGLEEITGNEKDNGRFKIPSLRNVSLTPPYMHDGSMNSLEEVIDLYARGGRNITQGPFAGDGRSNTHKDKRIGGFSLSPEEKKELIGFLFSLTDSSVLTNPSFQNPFNLNNN